MAKKKIMARLVAPGSIVKRWSFQAINLHAGDLVKIGQMRALPELAAAEAKWSPSRHGWVKCEFHVEDQALIEAAARAIAKHLGARLREGDFSAEDFMPSPVFVWSWLEPLLGKRELAILLHPAARFLKEDQDGNRMPPWQQWIESPMGTLWLDSQAKTILG